MRIAASALSGMSVNAALINCAPCGAVSLGHGLALRATQRPILPDKQSRSIVHCPILACNSLSGCSVSWSRPGSPFEQPFGVVHLLASPILDLIGVHIVLLDQLRQGSSPPNRSPGHFGPERRRVIPALPSHLPVMTEDRHNRDPCPTHGVHLQDQEALGVGSNNITEICRAVSVKCCNSSGCRGRPRMARSR